MSSSLKERLKRTSRYSTSPMSAKRVCLLEPQKAVLDQKEPSLAEQVNEDFRINDNTSSTSLHDVQCGNHSNVSKHPDDTVIVNQSTTLSSNELADLSEIQTLDLRQTKSHLLKSLTVKEEKLRKLKMVKMYRGKVKFSGINLK